MKETLYRKVFVNGDEKNLPSLRDNYIIKESTLSFVTQITFDPLSKGDRKIWTDRVDWYLIEQEEEQSKGFEQFLREEFLINTQNYPTEYHELFLKKFKRAERAYNESLSHQSRESIERKLSLEDEINNHLNTLDKMFNNPPMRLPNVITDQNVYDMTEQQCNCAKTNQLYTKNGKPYCATCNGLYNISNPTA